MASKGPRNSRPPRPRSLAQRKLRQGLPPTIALRTPAYAKRAQPPADVQKAQPLLPPAARAEPAAAPAPAADSRPLPPRPDTPAAAGNALLLRGDYWELRYNGRSAMAEDCRGLRYIAILIQRAATDPRPLHARELVALTTGRTDDAIELEARDAVLDDMARAQLFKRLEDLAAERDRACDVQDLERAARLDDEYERIATELRHAQGSGKQSGRGAFADTGERARKAVSKAISEAIARIAAYKEVAPLADHLAAAIRKGQWLSYAGGDSWEVDVPPPPPRK